MPHHCGGYLEGIDIVDKGGLGSDFEVSDHTVTLGNKS